MEYLWGYVCSDTGEPCTGDLDCPAGDCDQPIDDETWLETNGYVEASARFAGYTQVFGYYGDICPACSDTGESCNDDLDCPAGTCDPVLAKCSDTGLPCTDASDCPTGTCDSLMGELMDVTTTGYLTGYDTYFLVGDGEAIIGFYDDPSGSPPWFSQDVY
jgi:hypothetical protein